MLKKWKCYVPLSLGVLTLVPTLITSCKPISQLERVAKSFDQNTIIYQQPDQAITNGKLLDLVTKPQGLWDLITISDLYHDYQIDIKTIKIIAIDTIKVQFILSQNGQSALTNELELQFKIKTTNQSLTNSLATINHGLKLNPVFNNLSMIRILDQIGISFNDTQAFNHDQSLKKIFTNLDQQLVYQIKNWTTIRANNQSNRLQLQLQLIISDPIEYQFVISNNLTINDWVFNNQLRLTSVVAILNDLLSQKLQFVKPVRDLNEQNLLLQTNFEHLINQWVGNEFDFQVIDFEHLTNQKSVKFKIQVFAKQFGINSEQTNDFVSDLITLKY